MAQVVPRVCMGGNNPRYPVGTQDRAAMSRRQVRVAGLTHQRPSRTSLNAYLSTYMQIYSLARSRKPEHGRRTQFNTDWSRGPPSPCVDLRCVRRLATSYLSTDFQRTCPTCPSSASRVPASQTPTSGNHGALSTLYFQPTVPKTDIELPLLLSLTRGQSLTQSLSPGLALRMELAWSSKSRKRKPAARNLPYHCQ
eukprot:4828025-Pleurochrysis_carterae.AAC.2